jgi:hypothetical protein
MTTTTLSSAWDNAEPPAAPATAIARPRRGHWKNAAILCATGAGCLSSLLALVTGASWPTILFQGAIATIFALLVLLPCACLFARSNESE